ncbi:DNA primase family protein [Micromonospora fulviviridis]|uniref:Phage/plasmid primase, P4 family n=1 Tax=Micromonospora fulviviridis TaxID=47860 RepID=A0ABV2VDM9_9ACTN
MEWTNDDDRQYADALDWGIDEDGEVVILADPPPSVNGTRAAQDQPPPDDGGSDARTDTDGNAHATAVNTQQIEIHRGQGRIAERLVAAYGDRLRYAHGLGWHIWDGARWAPDRDGAPQRAVWAVLRHALINEVPYLTEPARSQLVADVRRCETAAGVDGVLRIAANLRPVAVAAVQLDADPWLFNLPNGTLDLRTGELRAHDPADLITRVAGCGYEPHAAGPVFDRFLAEVLPDPDVRAFVQRLLGSAMFGQVRDHVLPILTGTGCNGKSTLVELVRDVFGDYGIAAEPELLVERRGAHPTGQADLLGIRLATTTETDEGRRLAAATVKRLTGGDKIRARRMARDFFEFRPSHTIIMVTNDLPKVQGDDPAIWRRIMVVPFDVVITAVDPELPDRLRLEMPAVLAWLLDGYRAWQAAGGLRPPATVLGTTQAYREASDPIGRFLEGRTRSAPGALVPARTMYNAWVAWCQANGEQAGSEVSFAAYMGRRGITKQRTRSGNKYVGVELRDEEDQAEQ